jgi:carboxyl-terminal processing protease
LDGVLGSIPGKPTLIPPEFARVAEQVSGNRYVGIGVQLQLNREEHFPQVVSPVRGGPLHRAGVKPGDLIVEVDGKSTRDVGLTKVVQWIRGDEGVPVTLLIRRPGADATRKVSLTRSVVPFQTVVGYRRAGEGWSYRIDPAVPVGYVWLESLTSSTLHELRQVESRLRAEGVRALVLDLRFGHSQDGIHAAALVADGLLDGGLLWSVRDARGRLQPYRADRECLFRGWPLAALVERHTNDASFAALAAALQDNGRAVLVGESIPADGYVTRLIPLADGQGSLSLRTGRVVRAVESRGWPLRPDHRVDLSKEQRARLTDWLRYKGFTELPAGVADRPPEDPQLARAVELLRAALRDGEVGSALGSR